ncbi:hypothetical protein EFR01_45760 [Sinorhizobium fredii]|nr:hypothetical protein EFR01_45760 [Sinorhizobium fredii]GLS09516.1 hypothetical protein GCM10007864_31470 [Sinorhizobium fredii]
MGDVAAADEWCSKRDDHEDRGKRKAKIASAYLLCGISERHVESSIRVTFGMGRAQKRACVEKSP